MGVRATYDVLNETVDVLCVLSFANRGVLRSQPSPTLELSLLTRGGVHPLR